MAQVIGIVKNLQNGEFFVKDAQGAIKALKVGDQISNTDLVYGAPNNPQNAQIVVDVTVNNASDLIVSGAAQLYVDLSVIEGSFEKEEAVASKDAVDNAWSLTANNQTDPNAALDPTAAGALEETAAGDQAPTNAEQPGSTLFDARTGAIGNVATSLRSFTPSGTDSEAPLTTRDADINDAPVAVDDAITVTEDVPFTSTINLNANDTDLDGDALTVIPGTFTTTAGGTIVIAEDGSYTYTPPLNFNGIDSVEYTVTDGELTDIGLLNITVTAVNDAPIPDDADEPTFDPTTGNYSVETPEDTPVSGQVVGSDVDGDLLTYTQASNPANGVVTVNPDGSWTYTPNPDYNGPDGFDVLISDGNGGTAISRVNIGVTPVNDAPIAAPDAITTNEDIPYEGTLPVASDVDGDIVTYTLANPTQNGIITVNPNGTYIYTPNENYNGTDSFTYTISDGNGGTATYTVDIVVNPANDRPEVQDVNASQTEALNGTNVFSGILVASDIDTTDTHTFSIIGTPQIDNPLVSGLSIVLLPDGTYTVSGNFNALPAGQSATVTFDYIANDGKGFDGTDGVNENSISAPQTVTLTVTGTNDQPIVTAVEDAQYEALDGTNTFAGSLVASDDDVGDTHQFTISGTPSVDNPLVSGLSVQLLPDGNYTVSGDFNALAEGESATVTFDYVATDSSSSQLNGESNVSEPKTVTLTITGTNDQPVVSDMNVNASGTPSWDLVAEGADGGSVQEFVGSGISNDGSEPSEGSAIKFTFTTGADELVSFSWDFHDMETTEVFEGWEIFNDFSFVSIDGVVSILEDVLDTDVNGNTTLSHTFSAGSHTVVFGVMNSIDDLYDSELNVIHISGGTDVVIEKIGNVSNNAENAIYESYDETDAINVDDTQGDELTTFTGTLVPAIDDDVSDSHTYALVDGTASIDVDIEDLAVVVNNDGTYSVEGNFNALAAGEEATVTFQYVAIDDSITQFNGESNRSEPKTVTLTITGTNDQPIVDNVTVEAQDEAISGTNKFEGKLSASDDDENDTHEFFGVLGEDQEMIAYTVDSDADISIKNITVNTDGTYSLEGDFNALDEGESAQVAFQYYAKDNSTSQANGETNISEIKTVTITINGTNDAPTITTSTGNEDNANDSVKESGLTNGTSPLVSDTQASGTFTIGDSDGLDDIKSITIEGTTIEIGVGKEFANLEEILNKTINSPEYGEVTISYDDDGVFNYTYTLTTPVTNDAPPATTHTGGQDIFTISVYDGTVESDPDATVTVDIVDDIPTVAASGFSPSSFELLVTNHDDVFSAGHHNSFGYYIKGVGDTPTTGVVIWDDVHDLDTIPVTITGYSPDQIGFFIIPNGDNANNQLLDGAKVTFAQSSGGEWQVYLEGSSTPLNATNGHILFDSSALNFDATTSKYNYVLDNSLTGNLNWEDIPVGSGSDKDNNDVNINALWKSTQFLSVDESTLNIDTKADFSQAFTFNFGADGAGTKAYALSIGTGNTGLLDTASNTEVTLHVNGTTIEGRAGNEVVFILSVNATTGEVTLDQKRAVVHGDANNPDDATGINPELIKLTASITDSDSDTDSASLDIGSMIRFEDDAPVAVNDTKTTNEDAVSVSGDVLANDLAGADGAQAVNFTTTNGAYGTLTFDTDGKYTYTLGSNAQTLKEGQEVKEIFNYTLTDKDGDTTQGKLTITVTGTNDAPVIDLDGVTNMVYTESFENLLTTANTWTVITNPTFTGDAGMTWTTEGGREGLEVQNGNVGGSLASDGAVHAELDSHELVTLSTTVTLTEGTATLTFDYKPRPGSLTDSDMKVTLGDETFTIKGDGSIIGASSDLQFNVTSNTTTGWMSVTVNASSLPLGATTLSFEGLGNSNSLGAYLDKISLVGGIANDNNYETTFIENGTPVSIADIDIAITDVDDTHMESALITLTNPKDGDLLVAGTMPLGITATVSGNTITLNGHATIDDYEAAIRAITYKSTSENPSTDDRLVNVSVNDGDDNSNTALTTVFVIPVNDAPDAVNDTLSGAKEDVSLVIQASQLVPTNDTDVDGDSLSITGVGNPTHGTVVLNPDGTITFTPEVNFSGDATFEYTITDGELSDTATVTIHVDPVADAPLLLMSVGFNETILGNNIVVNGSFEDVSGINENGVVIPNDVEISEDGLVKRLEIPGWKLDNEGNPIAYALQGDGGASIGQTQLYDTKWYGIDGSGNADSAGVDKNETLKFDLNIQATKAEFDLKADTTSGTFIAYWTAYANDGTTVVATGQTTSTDLTITSFTAFRYVSFDPHSTGNSNGNSFFVSPVSSTTSMPPMEPHDDGHAGVGSTDGENYMDLGASPGNTAIYQEFTDLVVGQTYQLKVDYRDKAFMQENITNTSGVGNSGTDADGMASGVMQVLWNGVVIATIDGNNRDAWETFTFDVKAANGTNKLTFNEIGVADDNWGMAIDNVRIYGETFQYALHVTATLTDNEILGTLIIDGDTLPEGIKLYQDTVLLVANADGDYEITLEDGVLETLTLLSPARLSVDEINTIEASISSTDGADGVTVTETALNEVVGTTGTDGDDLIIGTDGNDVIDGGAGSDVIHAGTGDDTIVYDATDSVIDGGEGEDTLIVPDNVDINFGALDTTNNPIENIETIDLETGDHDLTNLSLEDVIDMTDADNELTIIGDAGDSVDMVAGTPEPTDTTVGFDTYTSSDPTVVVHIEETISQTI
jgi:VCBS repeat-containing protein